MSNNFRLSEKYDNQTYLNDVSFSKATLSYLLVLPGKIKLVLRVTQTKCQMNMPNSTGKFQLIHDWFDAKLYNVR
jgi:hypothetical protein